MGVIGPLLPVHIPDDLLITGQFNVPAQKHISHPQQRMEPIHRQQQEAQEFPPVVSTVDMGLFMSDNMGHGILVQIRRQVDLGMYYPQDKREAGPLAAIKVTLHSNCCAYTLSQTDIAANCIEQQNSNTHHPNGRRNGNPNLERIDAVFRSRCRTLLQNGIYNGIERGNTAVNGGDWVQQRLRRDGLGAGNQAPNALQSERAQQPYGHQAPQQKAGPLGRFFQKQPQHQNRQHQPSGGNSTVEQG